MQLQGVAVGRVILGKVHFSLGSKKCSEIPIFLDTPLIGLKTTIFFSRESVHVKMILVHAHLITNLFVEGTARHIPIIALLGVKKCEGLVKEDAPALDPDRNQLFSENELTLLVGTDLV